MKVKYYGEERNYSKREKDTYKQAQGQNDIQSRKERKRCTKHRCLHRYLKTKIGCKKIRDGGGQVISALAFYSDDAGSNPDDVYNISVNCC